MTRLERLSPWLAMASVLLWVLWNSAWDGALYGDNVEQFIWAHSMEWGYHKHPPLPTWLLGAGIALVGPKWWLANALAALCFAATGWFTWLISRRLLGGPAAALAMLLWSLQQCFSVSAQIYNHNTVLVLCMAALVWCVLQAVDVEADTCPRWRWWAAAGVLAGLSMLAKYQALAPLAGIAVATAWLGKLKGRHWQAAALAVALALAVFAPHLLWLVRNDFTTLRYAQEAVHQAGLTERLAFITTFFVNQIRMVLPMLVALAICWAWQRVAPLQMPASAGSQPPAHFERGGQSPRSVWLLALVWGPVLAVVVAALLAGSVLRNHWGVQMFQFFALWVAWRWRASAALHLPRLLVAALLAHGIGLTYYAIKQSNPQAAQAESRADSAYPARAMAAAALAHWSRATACPLRYVVGDFEAGLVSVYSGQYPVVVGSARATPWVDAALLKKHGALVIEPVNANTPSTPGALDWVFDSAFPGGKKLRFSVQLPSSNCR